MSTMVLIVCVTAISSLEFYIVGKLFIVTMARAYIEKFLHD